MRQRKRGFDLRQYTRSQEGRLIIAFFLLLYIIGGGLIWFFYGLGGTLLAFLCMTGGLVTVGLLYGVMWVIGKWAGEE